MAFFCDITSPVNTKSFQQAFLHVTCFQGNFPIKSMERRLRVFYAMRIFQRKRGTQQLSRSGPNK